MFERFTGLARRVLVLAQEESRVFGHSFIGTEHILLGLIEERDGIPAQVFAAVGVSLESAREKVRETIGATLTPPPAAAPFTPRAKKLLERSLKEALALRHKYIGPEHLLLGLVALDEGVGVDILADLGVDLTQLRESVLEKVVPGDDPPGFSTDYRIHGMLRPTTTRRVRSHRSPLRGWSRHWYGRIVRLPVIFYP